MLESQSPVQQLGEARNWELSNATSKRPILDSIQSSSQEGHTARPLPQTLGPFVFKPDVFTKATQLGKTRSSEMSDTSVSTLHRKSEMPSSPSSLPPPLPRMATTQQHTVEEMSWWDQSPWQAYYARSHSHPNSASSECGTEITIRTAHTENAVSNSKGKGKLSRGSPPPSHHNHGRHLAISSSSPKRPTTAEADDAWDGVWHGIVRPVHDIQLGMPLKAAEVLGLAEKKFVGKGKQVKMNKTDIARMNKSRYGRGRIRGKRLAVCAIL
jgi:hypothetical protein